MPLFAGTDLTCLRGERLVFQDLCSRSRRRRAGAAGAERQREVQPAAADGRAAAAFLRKHELGRRAGVRRSGPAPGAHPLCRPSRRREAGAVGAGEPGLLGGHGGAADPGGAALAALERLGVPHIADIPGRYLSAGQKRRLNLARILAAPAPLWLLDEPSVALDRAGIGQLEAAIADHRAGGDRRGLDPCRDRPARRLDPASGRLRPGGGNGSGRDRAMNRFLKLVSRDLRLALRQGRTPRSR